MTDDPELAALATRWKENDMTTLNLTFTPAKLAHATRWEGRLGLVFAPIIGGFALMAVVAGWRAGEPAGLALGVFLAAFAVALGRGVRGLRARARVADALLAGTPVDVARGHRHHVHTRLCALRSSTAIGISVAPFPLYVAFIAYGVIPVTIGLLTLTGYAGVLAWVHLRRVPALRAERTRLDALVEELAGE